MKLHTRLLVALVLGIALGAALHSSGGSPWTEAVNINLLRPIGQIFLRLIFMIVVPMVFSALVIGVYELGRAHGLAGVVGRTLRFTVILSTLSVVIGMALVNLIRPGAAFRISTAQAAGSAGPEVWPHSRRVPQPPSRSARSFVELIPRNPIDTAVRALDGEMLQLMIFALIFGVAVSAATPKGGRPRECAHPSARTGLRRVHAHRALRHAARAHCGVRHHLQHGIHLRHRVCSRRCFCTSSRSSWV